jgi:hypothetical protein
MCVTRMATNYIHLSDAFNAATFAERMAKGDFDGRLENELAKLSQEQLMQIAALLPPSPAIVESRQSDK